MPGCAADGSLNDSDFAKPLPTIGLYITGASLYCAAAMGWDTFRGFRSRRLWFPACCFTLNAATLTLLAVATKLPVDLNTSMPGPLDQLSKLSGTVLLCTVMGNLTPSLGVTDNAADNILALGILVVTVVVNVAIQMGTGVIYVYRPEHAVVLFLMLVLLLLLSSSALTVPTTKSLLEKQYDRKHHRLANDMKLQKERAEDEGGTDDGRYDLERLKEHVKKYWLMAHTSSPQYVLGRSATCTASGAFCLLSALALFQAALRTFVAVGSGFCHGTSDYTWSILPVFISQVIAVVIGTVAPAFRWFNAVSFRSPEAGRWHSRDEFRVEKYWVQELTEWRDAPLKNLRFGSWQCQKNTHTLQTLILGLLIRFQKGVVVTSKGVCLLSILPVWWLSHVIVLFRKLGYRTSCVRGSGLEDPVPRPRTTELEDSVPCPRTTELEEFFVLHLEGEEDLVKVITRNERKDIERWIEKGKKQSPTHLACLVKDHANRYRGFIGLDVFDSDQVRHPLLLASSEPERCWVLPVVTVASIASALPGVDQASLKQLLSGVREGLPYVRLIEKYLEAKGLLNQRKAADVVWSSLDLHSRWFDWDLRRLVPEPQSIKGVIERLRKIGEDIVSQFLKGKTDGSDSKENSLEWPPQVLAAYCMYRVTSTIQLHCDSHPLEEELLLFNLLRRVISDLLGACLTNLPKAIYMECFCNSVEVREESVRDAAFQLGEAGEIMTLLANEEVACLYPDNKEYVNNWRKNISSMSRSTSSVEEMIRSFRSSPSSITTSSSLASIPSGLIIDEPEGSMKPTQQQGTAEEMVCWAV